MSKLTGINPKLTVLVIIGLLLAAALTGCVPRAPHEQLVAAIKKVNDLEYQEMAAKASMSLQSDNAENQKIYELISKISFEVVLKLDKKDHRYFLAFDLLYKGVNCGNLALYCDTEKITAQSVFFGPKTFCFEWKDLQRLAQDYLGLQVQITDYLPLLFETDQKTRKQVEKALYDFYADYFRDKITAGNKRVELSVIENDQEKSITCQELIMQMDNDDFSPEEIGRFLQGILGNSAVRSLIKEKITQFITIAKNNGDLATWPVTEEELIAFRDNIDTQIDHFQALLASTAVQAGTAAVETSFTEMNGKIRIDKKGLWRNMLTTQTMAYTVPYTGEKIEYKMTIEQNLVNPGQKPAFPEYLPGEVINVGQTSSVEWEAIAEEISTNIFTQLLFNPLFQDIAQLGQENGL